MIHICAGRDYCRRRSGGRGDARRRGAGRRRRAGGGGRQGEAELLRGGVGVDVLVGAIAGDVAELAVVAGDEVREGVGVCFGAMGQCLDDRLG